MTYTIRHQATGIVILDRGDIAAQKVGFEHQYTVLCGEVTIGMDLYREAAIHLAAYHAAWAATGRPWRLPVFKTFHLRPSK